MPTLQDELRQGGTVPPPAARRRWDLVALWVVVLGPAVGLALWAGARQRVGDLEERLMRDANATFSAPHVRPVHVEAPLPGEFGDAVARHLPPIQAEADAAKGDEGARDLARAILAGERSLADLPERYSRALARLGSNLDGLLRGTRAERAGLAPAREAFAPCDGADWMGYQHAALLAGLRIRRALASGDATSATEVCLDGLALGRDAAISGGRVGYMVSRGIVGRLAPACASAVAALGPAERAGALAAIRAIRDAHPSPEEMLRVQLLSEELMAFGRAMGGRARARLAPWALSHVRQGERDLEVPSLWGRLFWRDGWRSTRASWDALLRAARTERGPARDEAFDLVDRETFRFVNPMAAMVVVGKVHAKFARRAEATTARLDALAIVAAAADHRDRTGAWPASVAALAAAGLLGPGEAERAARATLAPRDGGRSLELRLPLPTGDEKDDREITLRIARRGSSFAR